MGDSGVSACRELAERDAPAFARCGSGEEEERAGGGAVGRGVVDDKRLAVGLRYRQLLVAEIEGADLWMVNVGRAAAFGAHVVTCSIDGSLQVDSHATVAR
jgi:hypothetical protein